MFHIRQKQAQPGFFRMAWISLLNPCATTQTKLDLHELSEVLPTHWKSILTMTQRCHSDHVRLITARQTAAAL